MITSVKQRHIDQIIDDVNSGRANGNRQIQSNLVKLMDDETNTITPVPLQNAVQSVSSSVTRNGNGGNVMALPQNIASVEVHASADHEQLSGSCQNENVPNSCEVGQESTMTQTANTGRPNVTEVNQANETAQDNSVWRQRSTITVDDLDNALKTLTGRRFSEIASISLPLIDMAAGPGHDNRGLSMTRPSIARSVGVSGTERQPMVEQSSQHEGTQSGAVPNNVANDDQDPELVRPPMAQRSGSMTTILVEDAGVNDRDDQQSLSAMMGRALEVHDSMLSQLKQNETLICELQGQAENGAPVVSGERTTSDPGSSSLRGFDTPLSAG